MTHAEARAQVRRAFRAVVGREPTTREAQYAQAVALCETGYGEGWGRVCGGAGVGSHNVGAIQRGRPPCRPDAFRCRDTHAGGQPYAACFARYATTEAGWDDLIRVLYERRPAVLRAASGDVETFARRLRESGYFELPLAQYVPGIMRCLRRLTGALGEPMPPRSPGRAGLDVPPGGPWPAAVALAIAVLLGLFRWRGRRRRA